MKVYRITKCRFINDLSGTGASLYGGRWHSKGDYVLYTAASASLAMLESIAHMTSVVSLKMCIICLQLPDAPIKEIRVEDLPASWVINPPPDELKVFGDNFLQEGKYLALKVPSVLMPEESNYILNPAHKSFSRIAIVYTRNISFDERLLKR